MIAWRRPAIGAALVAAGLSLWFAPVPEGATPEMMRAAALVTVTIGAWATMVIAEHLVALGFFLGAMVLHVGSAPVIFSGFASAAFWLVFGGLIIGAAVDRTGLGRRIASSVVGLFRGGYLATVAGVVTVCMALGFLMPSTMGRVVLLLPIVSALATRLGYPEGSRGRTGLIVVTGFASYLGPVGVLPANVPNNVLLGAAQTFYDLHLTYFDWLILHLPVLGLLKMVFLVLIVGWLFHDRAAEPGETGEAPVPDYWSRDERWLAVVLTLALGLWATDEIHGVSPAWISLGAGLFCMLPGVGLMPPQAFRDKVPMNPLLYIGGILGIGALVADSGLGEALADRVLGLIDLDPAAPARSFFAISGLTALVGTISTMPGVPAILAPIAGDMAAAAGLPVETVLMMLVVGFSTVLFPYQVPPLIVLLQISGIPAREAVKTALATAAVTVAVVVPVNYLWWRLLGWL